MQLPLRVPPLRGPFPWPPGRRWEWSPHQASSAWQGILEALGGWLAEMGRHGRKEGARAYGQGPTMCKEVFSLTTQRGYTKWVGWGHQG